MLTITPISFSGIRTLPQGQTKFATLPKLKQDTFQITKDSLKMFK